MPKHEQSPRALRIGEEMRHALARIFEHGLHDPALMDVTVTVTEVRVTPDLKNATAFVMPLAGAHMPEVIAGLKRAEGYLRREVAQAMKLRYAPALHFALDTSFEHASQIDALLRRPEVARDLGPPRPPRNKTRDAR
ncbi:MAG: 30S ribosome-binding factor RbfA [Alphaproteobacteria bacterium]|nr:30S ribosome-binding factor RbfA [Alphaproteobacteria bacterium]